MNKKISNILVKILVIVCLVAIFYSAYKIYDWYYSNKKNAKIKEQIDEHIVIEKIEGEEEYNIDFEFLKKNNKDTIGYLKVNNTNINYIVVKASNNDYYINHNYNREYNISGWIFADYRNKLDGSDKNIIIYGHNIKDGSMFGSLKNVLEKDWYESEENLDITFITEDEESTYRIFSIYVIKKEDYYTETYFNDASFEEFIKVIKSRSINNFNVDVTKEDSILTLSTCSNGETKRLVVHAKKIV